LEVLVGKTIEQSLIEVLEEEEIAALKTQQRKFLELRDAEKAEEQRLAEEERRRKEQKVRIFELTFELSNAGCLSHLSELLNVVRFSNHLPIARNFSVGRFEAIPKG